MLGVGSGAAAKEIEAEPAPRLGRVEVTDQILAAELLALEELGNCLHLLPGPGHAPVGRVASSLPLLGERGVGEHVGAVVEVVAIAVDRDAVGLAVPGADWRLQV